VDSLPASVLLLPPCLCYAILFFCLCSATPSLPLFCYFIPAPVLKLPPCLCSATSSLHVLPQAERIHQPSAESSQEEGGKSPKLPLLRVRPKPIKKSTLGRAPFNQSGSFVRAPKTNQEINFGAPPVQSIKIFCARAQNQSSNQLWGALTLITRQPAAPSPFLCVHSCGPLSPLSLLGQQGPTHPSTPFVCSVLGCSLVASVWTFGDNAGDQTEVKIKHVFTAVHEFPWLKRKMHSKVQRVSVSQVEEAGMLYRPACKDAYKRKSWAEGLQSVASD